MNKNRSFLSLLSAIFKIVSRRNKFKYALLIIFVLLTSLIELLSIGAIVPFLMALGDAPKLYENPSLLNYWPLLGINSASELPLKLAFGFGILALFSGFMRIAMTYISAQINRSIILEFGRNIYQSVIYKKFEDHSKENSSEIVGILTSKISILNMALNGISSMFSSLIIMLFVVAFLFRIEPEIVLSIMATFGVFYFLIIRFFNSQLRQNAQISAYQTSNLIQILKETLDGIREIILNNSQQSFINEYTQNDNLLRSAQARSTVIGIFPRFLIESIGIFGIAMFALYLINQGDGTLGAAIPTLAVIAMAVQRLLPLGQQVYNGWALINGSSNSIWDTLDVISVTENSDQSYFRNIQALNFDRNISFKNVSFSYKNDQDFMKNINLTIPKGSKIGIFGSTGSGKSTIMDLLMGFISPTDGSIYIDDVILSDSNIREWQQNISHVPQKIYIQDSNIASNIALSSPNELPDSNLLNSAASKAQILNFVNASPDGFNSKVGENGALLSGGQIQRIGIARALYKNSGVIIFDEPTSALDRETEIKILDTIYSLPKEYTIFIISHNQDAIKDCDILLKLDEGKLEIQS